MLKSNSLYVLSKFVQQEAVGIYYIPWPAKKNWEMFSFFEIIEILALSFYSDCLKYTNMQNFQ